MPDDRFTRAYARLRSVAHPLNIMTLATLAAALPFFALLIPTRLALLFALAACLVLLWLLARALRPIEQVAQNLERFAGAAHGRSAQAMLDNTAIIGAKLDALHRRMRRNGVTNLPTRNEFLAEIAEDCEPDQRARLLGVIRFANFDRMAAFDQSAADRALRAFADRFAGALGKNRPAAHVDRDCFAVWFRAAACPKTAAAELQAISYVLAQDLSQDGLVVTPDIQIGSAVYPIDSDDPGALLMRASVSMARPQRTAAGGIAFFAAQSPSDARRRFGLEQDLRRAMAEDQLVMHYQPLVDVQAGCVLGAEALLRWRHPALGAISPNEFVPILEESGLVHEIGLWTLNTACRQVRQWRDAGLTDLTVAVNLSAHQLRDPTLQSAIERTLQRYELTPQCIELELTETAAMEDAEATLVLFRKLQQRGFGLAIDDFGSGYSSLGYLKRLPFSKLKIDREFVSHVDTRPNSRAICKALIDLSSGLGIAVLAEGVERREEVEELRRLGCSIFQGFYFARPLAGDVFLETVQNPDWLALLASPVHRERADLKRRMAQ